MVYNVHSVYSIHSADTCLKLLKIPGTSIHVLGNENLRKTNFDPKFSFSFRLAKLQTLRYFIKLSQTLIVETQSDFQIFLVEFSYSVETNQ